MQADPATWIDILQGDERLYGQLVRPLSEIPATDPRYAQQVRGLKAVFEGLDGARSRERIAKVFLSESTTVSEALAPPEIATDWSVNPSRVRTAIRTAPPTKRSADQFRADVAAPSPGELMKQEPAFVAHAKRETARLKAEEAELIARRRGL